MLIVDGITHLKKSIERDDVMTIVVTGACDVGMFCSYLAYSFPSGDLTLTLRASFTPNQATELAFQLL